MGTGDNTRKKVFPKPSLPAAALSCELQAELTAGLLALAPVK
jgi:hypothetical protein